MKLTKRQLSLNLNVSDLTIYLWEKNLVKPSLAQIPKIIEFLGQDPFERKAENLEDKVREFRRVHGLSQKSLGRLLGIDASTIGAWEKSKNQPMKTNLLKLLSILCG